MKFDWIHATLVAALVYDTQVHYKNKARRKSLEEDNLALWNEVKRSHNQVEYLHRKMKEHELELTEFDIIMLNNL